MTTKRRVNTQPPGPRGSDGVPRKGTLGSNVQDRALPPLLASYIGSSSRIQDDTTVISPASQVREAVRTTRFTNTDRVQRYQNAVAGSHESKPPADVLAARQRQNFVLRSRQFYETEGFLEGPPRAQDRGPMLFPNMTA